MKKFWEKNKNWLRPILITLLGLVGYDQGPALLGLESDGFVAASPAPESPAWTITARLELLRNETISGPGKPSYTFATTDKAGEYTVVIPGYPRPTPEQIVLAAGFNPDEGQWKVVVVSEKRPPKPEEGQEPGEEEPDTE